MLLWGKGKRHEVKMMCVSDLYFYIYISVCTYIYILCWIPLKGFLFSSPFYPGDCAVLLFTVVPRNDIRCNGAYFVTHRRPAKGFALGFEDTHEVSLPVC